MYPHDRNLEEITNILFQKFFDKKLAK